MQINMLMSLKQLWNNPKTILFQFYLSFISDVTTALSPFTLHTVPYFDARMWMHGNVRWTELDLCGMLRLSQHSNAVCVNAALEINMLDYNVTTCSVNGV